MSTSSSPRLLRTAGILATGSYAPERILTNAELEKMVETTDEWILTRTGIRERRIARADETTSDMGAEAARRALAAAGLGADQVDLIIVATITPDMGFPNTACFVQEKIGAVNAYCYDIEAACSGFLYALEIARQAVACGSADTVLGAGAAVVQATGRGGLQSSVLRSDGRLANLLMLPGGGSRHPASAESIAQGLHYMKMEGRDVFKHAVTCMTDVARKALEKAGKSVADMKLIIPHQANQRIISAIVERLGGRPDQYFVNLERYGNTSAASIILALDEAVRAGRLQRGDEILLVAFGGGFTWGATVLEW